MDVEGGGATLIVTPAGESFLIDSGNPGARDAGRIHQAATEAAGLKRIDHYVTTHFHTDHFGGAAELSALTPIGQVYDNGIPETNPDGNPQDTRWPLLIKPYRQFKADRRNVIAPGKEIPLRPLIDAPRLRLRCVAARQKLIDPLKASPGIQAMYQIHRKVRDDRENNTADEFIPNLEEKCSGNYLKLSVNPSGNSYTVSIPATGHHKVYQTRAK